VTIVVLIILAVIWAAVLLPPWLQNRSENRPADSISTFQKQLSVLERRSGGGTVMALHGAGRRAPVSVGMSRSDARRRRREVLFTLVGAAVITLALALVLGGAVWAIHIGVDLILGFYVVLLAQAQQRVTERQAKVRYLPAPARGRAPEPALLLRRSGS
jgi:hypothetical protein